MLLLFTAVIFSGAALLFVVQPMTTRWILPLLGGGAAVWNTAMMFFQVALLAGYIYAHLLGRLRSLRTQLVVHAVVLGAGALLLPTAVPKAAAWMTTTSDPAMHTMLLVAATVGAPFFVLSTTGPLLQRWFSFSDHPSARDPYFLYVASNVGSLLALLAYPALLEPWLTLGQQRLVWAIGYRIFAVAAVAAGLAAILRPRTADVVAPTVVAPDRVPIARWTRLRWVMLAAVPSSLMLGTTHHLALNVAAVPLLWVVPLAIYLLTFIVAFSPVGPTATRVFTGVLPLVAVGVGVLLIAGAGPTLTFGGHLAFLLAGAMACHGRLAAERPHASRLTEFYLLLAFGGALGGIFNALVAPKLFTTVAEYPLAVLAVCLLAPTSLGALSSRGMAPGRRWSLVLCAIIPPAMLGAVVATERFKAALAGIHGALPSALQWGVPALICLLFIRRPRQFGVALAALLAISYLGLPERPAFLHAERTFFGTYSIENRPDGSGAWHQFFHGTTLHGTQYSRIPWSAVPTTYYSRSGPIGDVMQLLSKRQDFDRAAFIGLGAGTLAAYGRRGQTFVFYEIDPAVVRIASDPSLFTWISGSQAELEFVTGDARLTIAGAGDGSCDLIVVDAFSSDAIPVHLITREAVNLYLTKLAANGILVFHVTNRYLDLVPVLAAISSELELVSIVRRDTRITDAEQQLGKLSSVWVALARDPATVAPLTREMGWQPNPARPGLRAWTDDYSNILSVFTW